MGLRAPIFDIRVGGRELSQEVRRRVTDLTLTSTSDQTSDTLQIELSDSDGRLARPPAEREISIGLGYAETGIVDMGIFYHSETELQLAPRAMTIRATAADFRRRSTLKAPKRRSWDSVTLGDLVGQIAGEHGYAGRVHSSLSGVTIPHIDQTSESDLHVLRRLAREHDATLKTAGGYLVLEPRGIGQSAGGSPMPTLSYAPGAAGPAGELVLEARVTIKGRPRYARVTASYQDIAGGQAAQVTVGGDDGPNYNTRKIYASREEAEATASGVLKRLGRQEQQLEMTVEGEPRIVSESVIELEDWPVEGTSRWTVLRAEHSIRNRGYTTSLNAETAS